MTLTQEKIDLKDKRIIIIEDDVPSVKYYKTILENSGTLLTVFENGRDFAEYLNSGAGQVDILLVDYLVPFINGIDCVRLFRRVNRTAPVLMITAYYSEQVRHDAIIAGCSEYVLKPVYPEKLFCLLEKYLNPQHSFTLYRG